MIDTETFDPTHATGAECSAYLFALRVKTDIRRWWKLRSRNGSGANTERVYALAAAIRQNLTWVDTNDGFRAKLNPYALKVLGDTVPVSATETMAILDIAKAAAKDMLAVLVPEAEK